MPKKILLSDDTSYLGYTLMHRTSRLGGTRDKFDVLHLVNPGSSVGCGLAEVEANVAHFGCTLHTLDVSRLNAILEGNGLFDLIQYGEGGVNDPTKLVSLLSIAAVHARKLGYETIILGGPEDNDHLRNIVSTFNKTLIEIAGEHDTHPVVFEFYAMD
jgi:hypothetical protein